ncbi:MAG: sel1 repeat family protein [Candidatus Eremiobacteraeota bacterium]|nr:sel1 repeat family protein [Candidatus Eremiobacteraeota bacterium]
MLRRIVLYGFALAVIALLVAYVTQPIRGYVGPVRIADQPGFGPVLVSPHPSPTHEPFVAPTPFVHPLQSKTVAELQALLQAHDPEAQCEMAKRLLKGDGVDQDWQNGKLLLQVAARQNNPCALTNLGNLSYDVDDYETASTYYHKAADLDYPVAFYDLGQVARYGPAHDEDEAFKQYFEAAKRGYVPAYYLAGTGYITGRYGAVDKWLAFQWYQLGADADDQNAIKGLAWYYIYQSDEADRYQKAMVLLRKAPCACSDYEIGRLYLKGLGVAPDVHQAAFYFKRAADKGDYPSETAYADLLRSGKLGASQPELALRYYRDAADQGDGAAMDAIAQMTERGIGTQRDPALAHQMYVEAAAHCSGDALFRLAKISLNGSAKHPKDVDEAYALAETSIMCGYDPNAGSALLKPLAESGRVNFDRVRQIQQQIQAKIHDNTGNPNFAPATGMPSNLTGQKTSS